MSLSSSYFTKKVDELKKTGLFATPREISSAIDAKIIVDGIQVLNFSSNNYLGLANNSDMKNSAKKAIDKYGIGPAAVRTISGTTSLHTKLEKELSNFKKAEDVITFQSGFVANLAVVPAITEEGDVIFSDELNHASIIDACRLSKAVVVRYKHLDMSDLETKIKEQKVGKDNKKLIVTDGVFSMDGDIAPLDEIVKIAKKYDCITMVDDAHGEGVLGKNGRGIVDHFNLHGQVDIEVGTLSKAFGVVGGFAAGKKEIIDWLRQRARPFLFSSAVTIPDVQASITAVSLLKKSDRLVKKLWENAKYFKTKLTSAGFNTGNSQTPITPVILGDAKLASEFSKMLFEEKIFAKAITYPTVPIGTARIRVMISAAHSKKDLYFALNAFTKVGKKLGIIK
jgi:glycine C-acetyltransferase